MKKKSISFIRHYHGYTGGHQKVRDYIAHFVDLGWHPTLYLSNKAQTNVGLFDHINGVTYTVTYKPDEFEVVFLAGMDWRQYLPHKREGQKVINLIQHVRHGNPNEELFSFLKEPAIRLCVSDAVKDAIKPFANGPCHVINMGYAFKAVEHIVRYDVYVLANKQPELGERLASWLRQKGFKVSIHTETVEKSIVELYMASARVTVTLPNRTEGFYLPGIEAMYHSQWAVVPYCVANKAYFNRFANILMPDHSEQSIKEATLNALHKSRVESFLRKQVGRRLVQKYSLNNERNQLSQYLSKYLQP